MGLTAGEIAQLAPGVRRLIAPNGGMMTGPGTNTYLLGETEIAVLDPGPAIAEHVDAIRALAGAPIRWIVVTHTHPDHSPAARLLAVATGARQLGSPPPAQPNQDQGFAPDRELVDGDALRTGEFILHAVHTPGHASNHLCYLHEAHNWLFTGDHVMNGSTVVINPPDGSMNAYLASLRKIRALNADRLAPGHGDLLDEPEATIDWIIDHRLQREAKVVDALRRQPRSTAEELVPAVYQDVPPALHATAARSLLAHLLKLEEDGRAERAGPAWALRDTPDVQPA